MRKLAPASLAILALAAPGVASASLHPDATCSGLNPSGNLVCCVTSGVTGTEMCLNNVDPAGLGFNDPTAAAPVGGNTGTTVGEQRVNAYMESFRIWSDTLESSETIWVQGTFLPLACEATSGVLGAAGTIQLWANFDDDGGPSWPTTWYHEALANKLAAEDLSPGSPDPGLLEEPYSDDIISYFNSELGTEGCLEDSSWYYGYDAAEAADQIDFLQVLTHEVGHGVGHANFIDEDGSPSGCASSGTCVDPPGSGPLGWPDVYTVFSRDWTSGKHWNQMSDGQRALSAIGDELVWDGPNVFAAAPTVLGPGNAVRENSPDAESFRAQAAAYTPAPTPAGVTGNLVYWTDTNNANADPHDACELYCDPAADGNIALINRGSCNFSLKSAIAELCGATGVVIANNAAAGLPGMGGTALIAHTTVSVGIAKSAGDALKADLAGGSVNVTILQDATVLAGADRDGFPRLYAPNPVQPGSSVSHWDTTLTPNALMEPFINSDLDVGTTLDLTPAQMTDIGWDGDVHCPVGSDDSSTIVIDGCDTGVANDFGPWTLIGNPKGRGWKTTSGTNNGGCYLADLIHACAAGAPTHGDFKSCADNVANELRKAGAIGSSEAEDIKACADTADIP
jgi:hypothetical protein